MNAPTFNPPGFSQFVSHFFAGAAPEDIKLFSDEARQSIAKLFWQSAAQRAPGSSFVKVVSPEAGRDGFTSSVTLLATINDDKPFLVDSILSELGERGAKILAVFHPIFKVQRKGSAFEKFAFEDADGTAESMICVVVARLATVDQALNLEAATTQVLNDVSVVVTDWKLMIERLDQSIAELWQNPPKGAKEECEESLAFLQWLKSNHFTFLGSRDYVFDPQEQGTLRAVADSGLGLLRNAERRVVRRAGGDVLALDLRNYLMQPSPLIARRIIDVSGDGPNTTFEPVELARDAATGREKTLEVGMALIIMLQHVGRCMRDIINASAAEPLGL